MSSTDSDLDFQSADEDAGFDPSPKDKNMAPAVAPEEISSDINTKEIVQKNDDKDSVKIPTQNSDTSINAIEITAETSKTKLSSYENEIGENQVSLTKIEDISENVTQEIDPSIKPCNTTKLLSADGDKKTKPEEVLLDTVVNTDVNNRTDKSESHPEKERVILRREKKLYEKQQSSAQKEKASDLINLLEDPYKNQQSSWGFSSWGSSLLSSAASSVSTFSSQVSQGIGTVLETVESTLGAPEPEELARVLNERKKQENASENSVENADENKPDTKLSLLPDVSSWTKVLESTGSKVITGSLDTLEFIGKKTMDILTEGDPGLRKKRSAFTDRVNLSEILREAKAKADEEDSNNDAEGIDSIHYSQIFDEKQGLVHLEALEMLSKQSQAKLQRLLMRHARNVEVKKHLEEIKSICENIPPVDDLSDCENFEDFETVFKKHTLELNLPLSGDSIIKTVRQINDSISKIEDAAVESRSNPNEIFQAAICSLAEFTARSIETFHKITELIMIQKNFDQDLENCATNLTGLTTVMCIEINNLSARYHKCLDTSAEYFKNQATSENFNSTMLATNLYMEAANSNNYIQDAYQMLIPVLQVCLLEALD